MQGTTSHFIGNFFVVTTEIISTFAGAGQRICVSHSDEVTIWVSKYSVQNNGVAALMSKYCQYTSAEFCWCDASATSPYQRIYLGRPMHRSSSFLTFSHSHTIRDTGGASWGGKHHTSAEVIPDIKTVFAENPCFALLCFAWFLFCLFLLSFACVTFLTWISFRFVRNEVVRPPHRSCLIYRRNSVVSDLSGLDAQWSVRKIAAQFVSKRQTQWRWTHKPSKLLIHVQNYNSSMLSSLQYKFIE